MKKLILGAAVASLGMAIAPAQAITTFFSTFENVPGGPTGNGQFTLVPFADGWNATTGAIELQQRAAGNPDPSGGDVFVELDSNTNSSMSRTIDAGNYSLSFLYSPRPGVASTSNGIEVLLNGVLIAPPGTITGDGGNNTSWSTVTANFVANASSTLTFRAVGTNDTLGGYVDNINLAAVPEPASWAMMIVGIGGVGGTLRSRRRAGKLATA